MKTTFKQLILHFEKMSDSTLAKFLNAFCSMSNNEFPFEYYEHSLQRIVDIAQDEDYKRAKKKDFGRID